jgi:hypothetical protein
MCENKILRIILWHKEAGAKNSYGEVIKKGEM